MKTSATMQKNISTYAPSQQFMQQANISKLKLDEFKQQIEDDYLGFWAALARKHIKWHQPFSQIINESNPPFIEWFTDGLLNVSYNCLDRHLSTCPNKTAIIFESDAGVSTRVTYSELHSMVCKFANGLKSIGLNKGDRVVIYLPNSIEVIVAMQACARIGAIHSVVFGGFSPKALSERISDASAKIVITADHQQRGGKTLALKAELDIALNLLASSSPVQRVIVAKHSGEKIAWHSERDIWWNDLTLGQAEQCEPEMVASEHPLFILYTSGSTGTPKGVQHSSAGYLLGALVSMDWVFDYKSNDVFWSSADIGWITGHTFLCYATLAAGATQVIFGGIPSHPSPSRFWEIIEKYRVTIFYTAPTAIRALHKAGPLLPTKHDLSSLRLLGTAGEPINPEAWLWFYSQIGQSRCPIVDTWWQTETGSPMLSPMPGVDALKAGSCIKPLAGIMAEVINEAGEPLKHDDHGYLVITRPFPSQIRNIWNNPERFKNAYFPQNIAEGKYYVTGDSAYIDHSGSYWILGRIDDIINVSGHRLSTMEIEFSIAAHPLVAEVAVVGKAHEIKGEALFAFVVCKTDTPPVGELAYQIEEELRLWVGKEIGPLAKPDEIRFSDSLPKTRSGKIMRRLLRSIAKGEEISQDISTLENPAILEQLKFGHRPDSQGTASN